MTPEEQAAADAAETEKKVAADAAQAAADAAKAAGSDESKATIARLNAEAKDWREKFEAEKGKTTTLEREKMTELEQAKAKAKDEEDKRIALEADNRDLRNKDIVLAAARKADAIDVELIWRTIDRSRVEYDANGQPTNITKLVEEVKKAHPILFAKTAGSADNGARGGPPPTGGMNERIRRAAGHSA